MMATEWTGPQLCDRCLGTGDHVAGTERTPQGCRAIVVACPSCGGAGMSPADPTDVAATSPATTDVAATSPATTTDVAADISRPRDVGGDITQER